MTRRATRSREGRNGVREGVGCLPWANGSGLDCWCLVSGACRIRDRGATSSRRNCRVGIGGTGPTGLSAARKPLPPRCFLRRIRDPHRCWRVSGTSNSKKSTMLTESAHLDFLETTHRLRRVSDARRGLPTSQPLGDEHLLPGLRRTPFDHADFTGSAPRCSGRAGGSRL